MSRLDPATVQQLARTLCEGVRQGIDYVHGWSPVDPETVPRRDHAWYARERDQWVAHGFTPLGTLFKPGAAPGPYREMITSMDAYHDHTGSIIGLSYDLRPYWWRRWVGGPRRLSCHECMTTFTDGSSRCTSNTATARGVERPPQHPAEFLKQTSTVKRVVHRHRKHLEDHDQPPTQPQWSLKDVINRLDTYVRDAHAHREAVGWITRNELMRMGLDGDDAARIATAAKWLD